MLDTRVWSYPTVGSARNHIKDVLDSSAQGMPVTIKRDNFTAAVVGAEELRGLLADAVKANVTVGSEDGYFFALMEDRPFAAEGETLEDALGDLVSTLRDYSLDWYDRLRLAPNHAGNRELVQLVVLSTDDQLRQWLAA